MGYSRIVVRVEIATLANSAGKLDHGKMDRLAMILANLNNSGKEVIVVSSGAIALGADKLGLKLESKTPEEMQAIAAVGQAELIRLYQYYFNQYNQIVAQVLLTTDIMSNQERVTNARNTFLELLSRNIIPIVNENDAVSQSDIILDDNYTLALQVAEITKSGMILIKLDSNNTFVIQPRGGRKASMVTDETQLFEALQQTSVLLEQGQETDIRFPKSIEAIEIE